MAKMSIHVARFFWGGNKSQRMMYIFDVNNQVEVKSRECQQKKIHQEGQSQLKKIERSTPIFQNSTKNTF